MKKKVLGGYNLLIFILIDFFVSSSEDFMRQKLTLSIWAALLAVTISHADNLCVQLCTDCSVDPANATCSKVDQVCGSCPAILDSVQHVEDSLALVREQDSLAAIARADSIQKEKERKDSLQVIDVRKLAEILLKNCKSDTCNFEVTLNNGQLGHIRAKKGNKAKKESAVVAKVDSPSVALLPPMSEECSNLCGTCAVPEGSDTIAVNPICEKIETQCRCKDYAEQERRLTEKAKADSIVDIEKKLAMMEASQTAAQEVFSFCEQNGKTASCSTSIKVLGENLFVAQIIDLEKKAVVDTVAVQPKPLPEKKAPEQKQKKKPVSENIKAKDGQISKDSVSNQKLHPNPYKGFGIAIESFLERDVANYRVNPDKQVGMNFGYVMRWYFYQWGSFQTGVNFVYHTAEYEWDKYDMDGYGYTDVSGGVDYKNIMFDVPLQVRFGFPLGKSAVSPFVSASFHIRKPVYVWMDYDVNWKWGDNGLYGVLDKDYSFSESYSASYAKSDWEFLLYLGFGLELKRICSIQWQVLPISIVTYADRINNYYTDDSDGVTWRMSVDFVW